MNLVQEKRFDQAIESFERGLRLEPTSLLLLNALGATYSLKGNKEKAQQSFLKALDLSPDFEPARKNLAIAYFESGNYDLAAQQFERLLHSSGSQAVAHLFLGMICEKRKQYKQAIEFLEKAKELVFHYPQAVLSLAQSLCESDQLEKSSQVLDRLGEASGLSAGDWFQAGILYSRLGQYQQALKDFERAKQIDPNLKGIDYRRALVIDKVGRPKEAVRLLQELTSKEPDARSFNLLGHVAESAGEIDLSIQSYRKAAKLRPDDEDNYLDYSTLCMNYKNFSLALEIVDAGLAIIPHSYRLRVQKGAVLAELGRVEESKESFRFAMNLREDHREALLSLARTQAHSNEFNDAAQTLAEGVKKFPHDYYIQYYYGFVLLELAKRRGPALDLLAKTKCILARAVELNPTFPKSYFLLGKIYLSEDSKVAAEQFETCLRLDPTYAPAKYQLGRLYLKMGRRREGEDLLSQVKDQTAQQLEDDSKPRIQVVRE